MSDFTAQVSSRDGTAVVEMHGRIDGAADEAMSSVWSDNATANAKSMLLRFEDVDYINSTGIALIVSVLAEARKRQVDVLASGLSDHYKHIFEITRLSDFIRFCDDEGGSE